MRVKTAVFAREMVLSSMEIDQPESSDCNADDFASPDETIVLAQSDIYLGDFQGVSFYALRILTENGWDIYPGAYSGVLGQLDTGTWYFGVNDD